MVPAAVKVSQLDNPPRTRAISTAGIPVSSRDPFSSMPAIDLVNLKEALTSRLSALEADVNANPEHIVSTGRLLAIINARFASPQTVSGVKPMPTVQRPLAGG
jgi:hypothetical protein